MSDGNKGSSGKRTLVEEGTMVSGTMVSSCPIVVMGTVEGEISGPSMEIAEGGVVSGRIKVTAFSSRGEVAGELEAETVALAGRVRDETVIRARSLEVASAGTALQFGECELCIGDEPDKRRAIEEATGTGRKSAPPPAAAAPAERRRRNTGAVAVALEGKESGAVR